VDQYVDLSRRLKGIKGKLSETNLHAYGFVDGFISRQLALLAAVG